MIQVTCANCGLQILVPPTVQGRTGLCFGCGGRLVIPLSGASLQLSDLRYAPGTRIANRYVIEKRIGEGGMGIVYKAKDTLVEEDVALKFMNPYMLRTQRGQHLFIKEAQVARRLRHDNIVAVHDVTTTAEGVLYLTMELIPGKSLRQALRRQREVKRHLDVRFAVQITLQILAALEYAHKMVVHRDIKPENVMLLPGEKVKVLDFGLAVVNEEEEERQAAEAAQPGQPPKVVGTTAYAAPEQKHHQSIDGRADLYTVGLVLHELLTLRTPRDVPVTVMEVRPDVSPSILRVLDKALLEQREARWQSAGEFRKELASAYDESYRAVIAKDLETPEGVTVSVENMAYFEGGRFVMGNDEIREEAPQFETNVEPFYLDRHPVTVQEYGEFIAATGHAEPKFWRDPEFNGPRQPVTGVTWADARAYAKWRGKDLPTEAQWEFAARGRDNRLYPWGNYEPDTTLCNFGDYLGMPSIVTMHDSGVTPDGVFDMAGNIFEWTLSPFVQYPIRTNGNAGELAAPRRVVRGGSWHSPAHELRTMSRKGLFPDSQLTTVGFRCAVTARKLAALAPKTATSEQTAILTPSEPLLEPTPS